MALTDEQAHYWDEYLGTLAPENRPRGAVIPGSPGSPDIADKLIELYLAGAKTAGSGLVEDYLTAGDPVPQVGDHWIALDSAGHPRCILRTERVEMHPFTDIPEHVARAEGEGDLSLEYWKRAHAAYYEPHLAEWGLATIEDATVVTEFFTLVHK